MESEGNPKKPGLGSATPMEKPTFTPNSSNRTPGTPFPSSSHKYVLLTEWWLIKAEKDCNGKRLAVAGLTTKGQQAARIFSSAPIVKRYDVYTVETADGIKVRIQGFINRSHMHHNGFPPEACKHFLIGFPNNWDSYADEYFQKKSTFKSTPTSSSGVNESSKDLGATAGQRFPFHINEFPMGGILDVLNSNHHSSIDDVLAGYFTDTLKKFPCHASKSYTMQLPSDTATCRRSMMEASLPEETMGKNEVNKSNQKYGSSRTCVTPVDHDVEHNAADGRAEVAYHRHSLHKNEVLGEDSYMDKVEHFSHNGSHEGNAATWAKEVAGQRIELHTNKVPGEDSLMDKSENASRDDVSHDSLFSANTKVGSMLETVACMQKETLLESVTGLEKDDYLVRSFPVDFLPNHLEGNLGGGSSTNLVDTRFKNGMNGLPLKESDLSHLKHGQEPRNETLRSQLCAENLRIYEITKDPLGIDSDTKDANSDRVQMHVPLQSSLDSNATESFEKSKTSNRKQKGFKIVLRSSSKTETTESSSILVSQGHPEVYHVEGEPRSINRLEAPNVGISGISEGSSLNETNDMYRRISEKIENCNFHAVQEVTEQVGSVAPVKNISQLKVGERTLEEPPTKLIDKRRSDRLVKRKEIQKGIQECDERIKSKKDKYYSSSAACNSVDDGMNLSREKLTGRSPWHATEELLSAKKCDAHLNCEDTSTCVVRKLKFPTDKGHGNSFASMDCKSQSSSEKEAFLSDRRMNNTEELSAKSEARSSSGRLKKLKIKGKDNETIKTSLEVKQNRSVTAKHDCANVMTDLKRKLRGNSGRELAEVVAGESILKSSPKGPLNEHHHLRLQFCSPSSSVPIDEMRKLGNGHINDQVGAKGNKEDGSLKCSVECDVKQASQSVGSVEVYPSKAKAIGTIGKKKMKKQEYQYVTQFPLTRERAKKLSFASPESLNLRRSRSGRLLVPTLINGCQQIVYDADGAITGIMTGGDVLSAPCTGSKSEPPRKKKKLL